MASTNSTEFFRYYSWFYTFEEDTTGTIPKHGVCFYVNPLWNFHEVFTDVPNVFVVYLSDLDIFVIRVSSSL